MGHSHRNIPEKLPTEIANISENEIAVTVVGPVDQNGTAEIPYIH